MRLSRMEIAVLVWLTTSGCAVIGFFGFAVAAPWTFAVTSVAKAATACPGNIDPSWAAVECNHGKPSEWRYGLISDHPVRYAASIVQMVVGWGAFFCGAFLMKRFR